MGDDRFVCFGDGLMFNYSYLITLPVHFDMVGTFVEK